MKWKKELVFDNIGIINLGWIPTKPFDYYKEFKNIYNCKLNNCNNKLLKMGTCGLQGYIIQKNNLQNKEKIYMAPTYVEWKQQSLEYVKQYYSNDPLIPVDNILFLIFMNPLVVFPPLIVERFEESSSIGNNNYLKYWCPFFKNNENVKDDYMVYN